MSKRKTSRSLPAGRKFAGSVLGLLALAGFGVADAEPLIKSGDKLAFLGDSITQYGASNPAGYVKMVVLGLAVNGITVDPVFAGISGHRSNDMLARLEKDVLSTKPAFMTLSCGVNDVLQGTNGVPLDQFQANITEILDRTLAAGVQPVIMTATMISEKPEEETNRKLEPYNGFLRAIAKERKLPLADLNAQMQEAVKKAAAAAGPRWNRDYYLTCDSIHMGPRGNQMMAEGLLRTFGLDDGQIEKARSAWLEIPDAVQWEFKRNLPLRDYNTLAEKAAAENMSFIEYMDREFGKTLAALLSK